MIGVMLFTLLECLGCYVVYKNVFGVYFTKKKGPYVFVIIFAFALQGLAFCFFEDIWREINSVIIGLVATFLLVERNRGRIVALYPVVVLMYSVINILSSYILATVLGISQEAITETLGWTLLALSTSIIVFTLYGKMNSKRVAEGIKLSFLQVTTMLLGTLCCFVLIGFTQGVWNADDFIFTIREEVLVASMLLAVLFVVLMVWQHTTRTKALQIQLENEKFRLYLQGQQEHIHMILEDDERRRRLKHDLRAHMLVLNTYAQSGELEKLQEYLQKMEDGFCEEQAKRYTGILGIDAIINDIHKKAVEQNIIWSFEGTLKEETEISVFEWCTIFSNLLTNALEAVQEGGLEKRIQVKIVNIQDRVVLMFRNTCSENRQGADKLRTTKGDKLNHGLGLKNVEEIVKKRDGSISYKAQEGWFEVSVVL